MTPQRWNNLHLYVLIPLQVALLVALAYYLFSWLALVIAQVIA